MKFNTLLLLLTTFTAVVLSYIIPDQSTIQLLFGRKFYWGINGTDVVLYPVTRGVQPARWIIQPSPKGNFIKYIDGGFVQYNGDSKQLTITDSGSPWRIIPGIDQPSFICSDQDNNECATAAKRTSGWPELTVKAENKNISSPFENSWIVHTLHCSCNSI